VVVYEDKSQTGSKFLKGLINTAIYVQKNSEGKMKGIKFCCQLRMAVLKEQGESFFLKHPTCATSQMRLLYE